MRGYAVVKLLIISATNRTNSASLTVSKHLHELYSTAMECRTYSLCDMPHDLLKNNFYNQRHPEILKVVDEIKSVDALLFVLPEYHGSYPGIAKLFLDLMPSATFKNKKVALVGISDGHVGNLRGIDHFTGVMNYLRAHVIPLAPKISYVNRMINDSSFVPDERAKNLFTELFTELTDR